MFRALRPFFITLVCSWLAIFTAALYLQRLHPQSHWIMRAALPAFLIEAAFYLAAGFESTRTLFGRLRPFLAQPALLWISAMLPYMIFSELAGTFEAHAFYLLAALCAVLSFWFAVAPQRPVYDVGFLVIAAAPVLERVFPRIYRSPEPELRADVLGHLMWIRLGIMALLVLRGWNPGSFGFWPRLREWFVGALYYLIFIGPIAALALGIHDVRFAPPHQDWVRIVMSAAGTFFGALWVVAYSEELFFRGVLLRAVWRHWASRVAAIMISAILFGAAHLWFHQFPDWRRALVAVVLGMACGIAYLAGGGVRAAMVTHALVVTTWRLFFR